MRHQIRHASDSDYFGQDDLSSHLLALPKSRSRLGNWGIVAVLVGAVLAAAVLAFENYVLTSF